MTQHKGFQKFSFGTLSVFLSILMIVYLIPLSVYADLAPTIEGNEDTTIQTEQTEQITEEPQAPDAMFELTDRREQNGQQCQARLYSHRFSNRNRVLDAKQH